MDTNYPHVPQPTLVPGLPPLRSVACGANFTMAICRNGSLWGFGDNSWGQLGSEKCSSVFGPRRLRNLTASSVSCGSYHTMVRTLDGVLFAFGYNQTGQLGLKHNDQFVQVPARVKCPGPWSQVICGGNFTLLLDEGGSIWATGDNQQGQLGLGDNKSRSEFTKLANIKARRVVCGTNFSLCVNFQDQLLGWGDNSQGQLGMNTTSTPEVMRADVEIMYAGFTGTFVLAKDKKVYVTGLNSNGQLGVGNGTNLSQLGLASIPVQFFSARDAPPLTPWGKFDYLKVLDPDEKSLLRAIDDSLHHSQRASAPPDSPWSLRPAQRTTSSWGKLTEFLHTKRNEYQLLRNQRKEEQVIRVAEISKTEGIIVDLEEKLRQSRQEVKQLQKEERTAVDQSSDEEELAGLLESMFVRCERYCSQENTWNRRLCKKLATKPLQQWDCSEINIILWRMDLLHHLSLFQEHQINGETLLALDYSGWIDLGMSSLEACAVLYHREMMRRPGYASFLREGEEDCLVCSHHTQRDTQKLLTEHKVPLQPEWIQSGWTTPFLIYAPVRREDLAIQTAPEYPQVIRKFKNLRELHQEHLDQLSKVDDSEEEFWKEGENLSGLVPFPGVQWESSEEEEEDEEVEEVEEVYEEEDEEVE